MLTPYAQRLDYAAAQRTGWKVKAEIFPDFTEDRFSLGL
jgi:hypothetical protein